MKREEFKKESKESKKAILEFFPLSSISSHVFDSEAPYRGIYIHTKQEDLDIQEHFAENPSQASEKLRFLVDTDTMKQKVQSLIQKEEQVTVETWYDLTVRVEKLEQTTIKTVSDMNKSKFWESENELKIPSNKGIRVLTPVSSTTDRGDGYIGYDSNYELIRMTLPVIQTARVTDYNYQPKANFEHFIENQYIQSSIRYRYKDYTQQDDKIIDIWSYTPKGETKQVALSYPIGDNGQFSNLNVGQTIYLQDEESKIKRKIKQTTKEKQKP